MKSVSASLLITLSLFFSSGVFAEQAEQQNPSVPQVQKQVGTTQDEIPSCVVAGERCPACCTNNCKDCSGCKAQAQETHS